MYEPSEHQNNLDLLFIDLGKRAISIQNEYSIEKIVNIFMYISIYYVLPNN